MRAILIWLAVAVAVVVVLYAGGVVKSAEAGPMIASTPSGKSELTLVGQKNCKRKRVESTECLPPPDIRYHGTGKAVPKLKPTVCVTAEAKQMMTPPSGKFWFNYYLRYSGGSTEEIGTVIRTRCITGQWVTPGTRIGFWVDCYGYRWHYESARIKNNGTYTMDFVKKERIS